MRSSSYQAKRAAIALIRSLREAAHVNERPQEHHFAKVSLPSTQSARRLLHRRPSIRSSLLRSFAGVASAVVRAPKFSYFNSSDELVDKYPRLVMAAMALLTSAVCATPLLRIMDFATISTEMNEKKGYLSRTAAWMVEKFQESLEEVKIVTSSPPPRLVRRRARLLETFADKYSVNWNDPVLGCGTFGSVYLAQSRGSGESVALKLTPKSNATAAAVARETQALLEIQKQHHEHAHIIKLKDMYQDDGYFYLVLDLARGGEVFDDLNDNGPYTEAEAAQMIRQLASALYFLHNEVGLIHGDVKPENLMLKEQNNRSHVLLVDFGSAEKILPAKNNNAKSLDSSPSWPTSLAPSGGTTAYWSPERFQAPNTITPAMDMWSVGVILYILLTCTHPFDVEGSVQTDQELRDRICYCRSTPSSPSCSAMVQEVLDGLLATDPKRRLTASELLEHPWIQQFETQSDKKNSKR